MKRLLSVSSLFMLCVQLAFSQNPKLETATDWLNENFSNLKTAQGFEMNFSRKGPSGETFRFQHTVNGVEVFDSSVAIHVSPKNQVTYHSSTFDSGIETISVTPSITEASALQLALHAMNVIDNPIQKESKLYVYGKTGTSTLVYRITTVVRSLPGYWETIVDANNGNILSQKDISIYEKPHTSKQANIDTNFYQNISGSTSSVVVDGTAMVFDPDPLTLTGNLYGGDYVDNNDNTNAALDAARTPVTLFDIDFDGTNYRLKGPYTEIAELQAPATGLFLQPSPDFSFTRDEQGFEAANCYHHIDKSFRYINEDLGIPLTCLQHNGIVYYDPHAFNGADNSSYGGGNLNFGGGGVDDAEDVDVILHELGHGIHDWITNGHLSQVDGLSEGTGDYWANSYKRGLGFWEITDDQYFWVFGWDGHNPFWSGRVTNYAATYPGGLTGSIHTDGQIWSSVCLEIWELIGKENMDIAFLEGLAMTGSNTSQQDAAIAVRQAAIDMGYSCDDINAMTDRFEARGYVLPTYVCDPLACNITNVSSSNISECNDNGTPGDGSDDYFTADITVVFENAPATGTLDLSGDGSASVAVDGLTSPYTFVGVVFPSDGGAIAVNVSFSDDADCIEDEPSLFTAPEPCVTLGITDFENLGVVIYPNPAKNMITVGNLNNTLELGIYNILGQQLIDTVVGPENNTIDISTLHTGTYIIRIQNQSARLIVE